MKRKKWMRKEAVEKKREVEDIKKSVAEGSGRGGGRCRESLRNYQKKRD